MHTTISRRTLLAGAAALTLAGSASLANAADKSDTIIIYFSRTGTVKGLAQIIADRTGAVCLELTLKDLYAPEYSDMTSIARRERSTGARREIATTIPDLTPYKNVFIGTPYWWGGISIPMRTFLTDHPMQGKRVMPFVASGSSSPEGAWEDIETICTKAKIEKGFHVTQSEAPGAKPDLETWLKALGY